MNVYLKLTEKNMNNLLEGERDVEEREELNF